VANNSQSGFFSDYNDLYATGSGVLVHWDIDFKDILDWQVDVNLYDLHSIGSTVVNPSWAQPRFVDLSLDDYRIFDLIAGLRATSPTVDAGNPAIDLAQPAGDQNLLVNPGFESGLLGWTVNPGATTQSTGPVPFAGNNYFFAGTAPVGSATQTVDLVAAGFSASQLDAQNLVVVFGGRVRSASENPPDKGQITLTFLDGSGNTLGQDTVQATNVADRWELVGDRMLIPVGTRSVSFSFQSTLVTGTSNNSYLDGAFVEVLSSSVGPDQGGYGNTQTQNAADTATRIALRTPDLYVDSRCRRIPTPST
jgi:hypothetical protein